MSRRKIRSCFLCAAAARRLPSRQLQSEMSAERAGGRAGARALLPWTGPSCPTVARSHMTLTARAANVTTKCALMLLVRVAGLLHRPSLSLPFRPFTQSLIISHKPRTEGEATGVKSHCFTGQFCTQKSLSLPNKLYKEVILGTSCSCVSFWTSQITDC